MLRALREVFPKHRALFAGFQHVPLDQADAENPMPWRDIKWSAAQLTAIDRLEHIEAHLDEFPTEDALATYIQHPYHWTPTNPMVVNADPSSGFHDALHGQWSIMGSPALLGTNERNVDNLVFWRLHGWIDDIWERYREAAGIGEDEPTYRRELRAQCEEMHALDVRLLPQAASSPPVAADGGVTLGAGIFDQQLRPALAAKCGACHDAVAPNAGLILFDANASAATLLARIVSVSASHGDFALIEPGAPEKSWLYLKASGDAERATCTSVCNRQAMPPAGDKLSADELSALAQWIRAGATP
jgi:cytochrome c553